MVEGDVRAWFTQGYAKPGFCEEESLSMKGHTHEGSYRFKIFNLGSANRMDAIGPAPYCVSSAIDIQGSLL